MGEGDGKARCFDGIAVQRAKAVEPRLQSSHGAKLRSWDYVPLEWGIHFLMNKNLGKSI